MSEKKQPVDLGLLEEDDEFEEFPAEGNRLGCAGSRRLGHADRDSGLREEEAREQGPGGEAPAGSLDPRGRLWGLCPRDLPCDLPGVGVSRWDSPVRLNAFCFLIGRSHGDSGPLVRVSWTVGPFTLQLGHPPPRSSQYNLYSFYFLLV